MKIGYTEFSFGYAFTENLIRSKSVQPTDAPVFPNLVQEAQAGYDVRIDLPACPLFFQYKLPELMVRETAKEISQYDLAGIDVPFFRMSLMRRDLSHQHRRLIETEQRFGSTVYYATPAMENVDAFNHAYNVAQVHNRSVFFAPGDIGPLPDDKQHVIAYREGLGYGWLCSEPREIRARGFGDIDETLRRLFKAERYQRLEFSAEIIREDLLPLVPWQVKASEEAIRERIYNRRVALADRPEIDDRTREIVEELLVSREIARVGLGMELMVAQPNTD